MKNIDVTGFVLSGGMSKRLGEEKGLAIFNEKPLITYSLNAIQPICRKIYISANNHLDSYRQFGYEVIRDSVKGAGPMGGIISCLKQSNSRFNIIVSCDTPFLTTELFNHLLRSIENFQVAVPDHDGFIEPLCAVYATNVIWEMEAFVKKKNYKLYDFLSETNLKKVSINASLPFFDKDLFTNINTRSELKNIYE